MAQGLNIYYRHEHADNPVTVTTPGEVHALFFTLVKGHPVGSRALLTIVVSDHPWKSELSVGFDGGKGVLHYAGPDTPPNGVCSKNPHRSNAHPVLFYNITAGTEFPPNAEVSLPIVQAAVIEYLTTAGEQPTAVEWQIMK